MAGAYHYYLLALVIASSLTSSLSCSCNACQQIENNYLRCRCCHYHLVGGKRSSGLAGPPVQQTFLDKSGEDSDPSSDVTVVDRQHSWRPDLPSDNPFQNIYFRGKNFDKRQTAPAALGVRDLLPSNQDLARLSPEQLLIYLSTDPLAKGVGSTDPRLVHLQRLLALFSSNNEEADRSETHINNGGRFVTSSSETHDPIVIDDVQSEYSPTDSKHSVFDNFLFENWNPSNAGHETPSGRQYVLISRKKRDEISTKQNKTIVQGARDKDQPPVSQPRRVSSLSRYFIGAFSGPPVNMKFREKSVNGASDLEWSDLHRFLSDSDSLLRDDACC